jgi:putative ABC transport system substrate-binding protein
MGFVTGWAHPGGNVTGVCNFWASMGGKWLETLTEVAPRVTRIGFIATRRRCQPLYFRSIVAAAPPFAVEPIETLVRGPPDIEAGIAALAREPSGGLIVSPDPFTIRHRRLAIELAARYRLPAIYPYGYFTRDGGLVSYGVDPIDEYRQAAVYADRIKPDHAL